MWYASACLIQDEVRYLSETKNGDTNFGGLSTRPPAECWAAYSTYSCKAARLSKESVKVARTSTMGIWMKGCKLTNRRRRPTCSHYCHLPPGPRHPLYPPGLPFDRARAIPRQARSTLRPTNCSNRPRACSFGRGIRQAQHGCLASAKAIEADFSCQ